MHFDALDGSAVRAERLRIWALADQRLVFNDATTIREPLPIDGLPIDEVLVRIVLERNPSHRRIGPARHHEAPASSNGCRAPRVPRALAHRARSDRGHLILTVI